MAACEERWTRPPGAGDDDDVDPARSEIDAEASCSSFSATSSQTLIAASETPASLAETTTPIFSAHDFEARLAKAAWVFAGDSWVQTKHNKAVPVSRDAGEAEETTVGGITLLRPR